VTKPFRPRELRARIEAMLRRHKAITEESRAEESRADADRSPPWDDSETRLSLDEDDELTEAGWLVHNGLRVNPDMRLCELDNQPLDLTRSEFQLLVAIMRGHRRVISKNTLALDLRDDGMVEGYVSESDRRVVESHMAHLRRKLNDPVRSPRFIETVRGVGYRLTARQNPPPTPG
jgi:DNA-binding response OmpR family regulator